MGIQGLLQFLKPISQKRHISDFKGQKIGIDAYVWQSPSRLHRSVYSCSRQLILNIKTSKYFPNRYISFFLNRAFQLKRAGIEIVMVFDGAPMPLKAKTNQSRKQTRQTARQRGIKLYQQGNQAEAQKFFSQAVTITNEMVQQVIKELRKHSIQIIVAPYEADAQLAYMCKVGYIQAALSQDSDLLVFECPVVLFKLNTSGHVDMLALQKLKTHPTFNFARWTHDQFILMCILAGCDYLKSCRNIGIKRAYSITYNYSNIERVLMKLRMEVGKLPENYEKNF